MSHIHIPDGVLPVGWWLAGYVLTILIVLLAVRKIEKEDVRKRIPFLGVISALMLITMSVPVGALPFHINLTVLTGVLAGPWLGFIAIFIVNLLLGFIGHGGITVVGVNTLILGLELTVGWAIFQALRRYAKQGMAVGIATVLALVLSTATMLGVVGFSQAGWQYALPHDHVGEEEHLHDTEGDEHLTGALITDSSATDPEQVERTTSSDPIDQGRNLDDKDIIDEKGNDRGEGAISVEGTISRAGAIRQEDTISKEVVGNDGVDHAEDENLASLLSEISFLNLSGLIALALILIIGIGLETLVTVFIVNFFKRVRPDLIP